MRAPIAAAAALVLGVGAFFAIAIPAATANGGDFTIDQVQPSQPITFHGSTSEGFTVDTETLQIGSGTIDPIDADCTMDGTAWHCTYTPSPALSPGDTGIITVTFTDGTPADELTQQANFTVVDDQGFLWTLDSATPSGVHFSGIKPGDGYIDSSTVTVSFGETYVPFTCTGLGLGATAYDCSTGATGRAPGDVGTVSFNFHAVDDTSTDGALQRHDITLVPDPPTFELSSGEPADIAADFSANLNGTGHADLYLDGSSTPIGDGCDWDDTDSEGAGPYCTFYDLQPGLYHVASKQTVSGQISDTATQSINIPGAPTIGLTGPAGSPTIHGTGTAGDTVYVAEDFGEGGLDTICEAAPVATDGTWSCTGDEGAEFDPISYLSTYLAYDIDAATQGYSPSAVYRPTPTAGYTFAPGGVSVIASGAVPGGDVSVFLWALDAEGGESCDANEQPSPITCVFTGKDPGSYRINTYDSEQSPYEGINDYFTIPVAPAITGGSSASDGSVTLAGTGSAGYGIRVYIDQSSSSCETTVISSNGTWSCTISGLPSGNHSFQASMEDLGGGTNDAFSYYTYVPGGLSPLSQAATLTVIAPAVNPDTPSKKPVTPITPVPSWFFTVTGVDLNNVHPGDHFTVSGSGLPAGATVTGELHSTPVNIGSATVGPDGTFSLPVVVPADFEPGAHQLVMVLTPAGGVPVASLEPMTVVPGSASNGGAADGSTTTEDKSGDASNPHDTKGGAVGAEENILTHGLDSIADVAAHPGKIPAAFAIGLVLLLFAVLPAHLLNATLSEQYERFSRRVPAIKRRPQWFARLTAWLRRAPVLGGVLITTITAILFGFADPRFGFTLASLRLILGLAIALAIVVYGVNSLTSLIMRKRWNVAVQLNLRPLGLLLTVVGVVVSRLLDFSPGFLIGLVLGLTISERASAKYAWRAILVRSGLVIGISIVAWLGFSIFSAGENEADVSHFGNELFLETLVAIVTEGIVALLIELLPFRLLEGERLYRRSRVLWGAVYLLALVIFVVAVVPWEGNWATLGSSLWVWIAIVAGFGIVCTGIYLYFRFIAKPMESEDHPEGDELVSVAEEE